MVVAVLQAIRLSALLMVKYHQGTAEGSEVISFDDKGITHVAKVLKVHVHENEKVYRYGFWGGEYVDATPNHWVLNQYNAFVAIGSLGFDDCLVDLMGHLRPITSKEDLGMSTVYNLTVEQQHTLSPIIFVYTMPALASELLALVVVVVAREAEAVHEYLKRILIRCSQYSSLRSLKS